jgi:hypothetical protein
MLYQVDSIHESEYPAVVAVWEASVRATHDFLKEEDIAYFKPLILHEYLHAVHLHCVRNEEHSIVGFPFLAESPPRDSAFLKLIISNLVQVFFSNFQSEFKHLNL